MKSENLLIVAVLLFGRFGCNKHVVDIEKRLGAQAVKNGEDIE
jgi:hypothetical protein